MSENRLVNSKFLLSARQSFMELKNHLFDLKDSHLQLKILIFVQEINYSTDNPSPNTSIVTKTLLIQLKKSLVQLKPIFIPTFSFFHSTQKYSYLKPHKKVGKLTKCYVYCSKATSTTITMRISVHSEN